MNSDKRNSNPCPSVCICGSSVFFGRAPWRRAGAGFIVRRMALSREQFVARVVEIVRERFPLVKIAPPDEAGAFALSVNGAIAPLENLYRVAVLRPADLQHHVE